MKTTNLFASAVALAATIAASPVPTSSTSQGASQLASFDDLTAVPAVSELNPVGTYKGLNWKGFDILQAGLTGVAAQSGANVAANSIADDITQGAISITAATVASFDLQSLYFGCVLNSVETLASAPEVCTVAFTAYKKGSSKAFKTVNQSFSPTNPLLSAMVKTTFDSKDFAGLDRVDVAVVSATATNTLTGLLVDSVAYKTYSK